MNPSLPSMPISDAPSSTNHRPAGSSDATPDAAVLVMNAGHDDQHHTGHSAPTETLHSARHALRDSVRRRPLTAVAAAFALGAVLVRIAR
jgi:hypothetical protein